MEVIGIIPVVPNRLYSVVYDDAKDGIYDHLLDQWGDVNHLVDFFSSYSEFLENPFWRRLKNDPEQAALSVIDDALDLEPYLEELATNADNGDKPDLDDYFEYLDGHYKYVIRHVPMKGYGMDKPSLLRLYAIKMPDTPNCYIIVYGGIKLKDKIQNSPILQDEVFKRIDKVMDFLISNGIIDTEDF